MRIVIDANALSVVLDQYNQNHSQFKPVLNWLFSGRGKMTYGGTQYEKELSRMARCMARNLGLIVELKKTVGIIILNRDRVDEAADDIARAVVDSRFNDPHIIAIVIVGKCKIVCSADEVLHVFLQDKSLYPKGFPRPKIYTGLSSARILRSK